MATIDVEARRLEFFGNVWNHSIDPFQAQFDERRPLSTDEREFIAQIGKLVHSIPDDTELGKRVFSLVAGLPERLSLLLQFSGLTRNKIISDLKAVSSSLRVSFPSSYQSLAFNESAWKLAGPYLAIRLRRVLLPLTEKALRDAAESLNQATWPGFIRQERAKRSGHEGEYRLATLLAACGIPFEPAEKADNPLCPDAQLYGVSFDIVVPNSEAPQVCFKATVHTANIGQYGESKDYLEIVQAKQVLTNHPRKGKRPLLMALIDGIGFSSNRAGLDGVLVVADEFCQFRTLWKSVIVCSARLSRPLRVELPASAIAEHRGFIERYRYSQYVMPKQTGTRPGIGVQAGEGTILIRK